MKKHSLRAIGFALLAPCIGAAQTTPSSAQTPEVSLPDPFLPAQSLSEAGPMEQTPEPPETPAVREARATQSPTPSIRSIPPPTPTPAPIASPQPPVRLGPPPPVVKGEIRLNFQNASLLDVLNYLSEAAGFVIVQESSVTGTVNIVSRQSITADEAVDLLNAVLSEKGFTAIRNGRILKIVNRFEATKKDIPVITGSDPTQIPRKDGMVTQILPVRYVEVAKLVDNLRPLLAPDASISANESSNSIILADTQTNVHRMAEIIHALDTSVSSISTLHVYQLQYADSKSLAAVITQLFATDQSANNNQQGGFGGRGGRGGGFPPGFGGIQQAATPAKSLAQQAATRVIAVADEQSNSVIVSAPEELMVGIADIVSRIDTNIADVTETQIFRLQHADCVELSDVLNSLYSDTGGTLGTGRIGQNQQPQQGGGAASTGQRSQRALLQARVVSVADPRTNSVVVSAARETMAQIAVTVGRLDASDSKKQHVYVHRLENADPDNVASILRGMFSTQDSNSNTSGAQPSSSRLNQRTTSGATNDGSNTLGISNSNATGSSRN